MTPSFPRTGVSGHAGAVQRGDGNLHPESPYARNASNVSSDPKPREGTETRGTVPPGPAPSGSSDPKPREGTETRNPAPHPQLRHAPEVVRPKTPRGDGNSITLFLSVARLRVSSDPKPREGTETPRGWRMRCARKCRQTQNPERGRKLVRHLCLIQVQCPVVRPKTPRGDGNILSANSSTVPLSGRQTQNPERGRKPSWWDMDERDYRGRRTQNPERGRKLDAESHRVREVQQSSDPKPREGTET
ncbi:Uncharacterised protein [Mycobacterium tuberculosis]|nr:Uncharacterised protein [Mycobacterium tuberculosis]